MSKAIDIILPKPKLDIETCLFYLFFFFHSTELEVFTIMMKVWLIVQPETSAHMQCVFIWGWFSFRTTSFTKESHGARHFCQVCVWLLEGIALNDAKSWFLYLKCMKSWPESITWSQSITQILVIKFTSSCCFSATTTIIEYIFGWTLGFIL